MVIKIWKRLPSQFNRRRVLVSTIAYRRYWTNSLNSIHSDIFSAISEWVDQGSTVWDIGANCGVFTYAAAVQAGASGKVLAVEADLNSAALIEQSRKFRLSDEAAVTICPFAVSDKDGTVDFSISSYRSAASSLVGYGRFNKPGTTRTVPSLTLDTMRNFFGKPSLVKIDVEGAEHLLFRAASNLLSTDRPIIICECSGGTAGQEVASALHSADYLWRPMVSSDQRFQKPPMTVSDIVAVPAERLPEIHREIA